MLEDGGEAKPLLPTAHHLTPLHGETMISQPKMSEIMKEMSAQLLRSPDALPSSEAAHAALLCANIAWNTAVGLGHARESYRSAWETIEADNPEMWSEFKSNDVNGMIDQLLEFKRRHYPDDNRRILVCGMLEGKVHVEWLHQAAPGVDSMWEMRLFGLVRTGEREKAIQFLQETRPMSRRDASKKVKTLAAELRTL